LHEKYKVARLEEPSIVGREGGGGLIVLEKGDVLSRTGDGGRESGSHLQREREREREVEGEQ
jgi:hypothetical protein